MRAQLRFPKAFGRAQGVYQRLKIHGKNFSHAIHTAARIYAQAQPVLRDAGVDTAMMDRGLDKAYTGYKMIEERVAAGDRAVNLAAAFIRPHFQGY